MGGDRARARRIVFTGGPGGGKTSALEIFRREFPDRFLVVPEMATMLYLAGFPRFADDHGMRAAQTAIFQAQRSLEDVHADHYPDRLFLCDRGTVDGAAYWPEGPDAFFAAQGTTQEKELERYSAVIFFETAAAGGFCIDNGNRARTDSVEQACGLDRRVAALYERHPHFHRIPHNASFFRKLEQGLETLRRVLSTLEA